MALYKSICSLTYLLNNNNNNVDDNDGDDDDDVKRERVAR